ncbi:anthranilate phosphoribosyltransferase [Ureibacillus sinduriensis]|uniref:Anthranilate phosphoribosyltransferase n=1 Tax=Ureibacillus sinduriensis BLB-1 = JCM 15800 TaxID=1384057 RepID=A0A0A3HTK4_9BACL|nr:anthranilate phosphoribosyltransferase [Ureibacillus sinduriensis]KGR75906.1 anthranilate phosphoribosyltransferase [Ureibacillus sinduriensis BLB-1 = JCM 15800]
MTIHSFTSHVKKNANLAYEEMLQAAQLIFNEETPKDAIAELLIALSKKGETTEEIAALATVMKSYALPINLAEGSYLDNCGTGGDGLQSFNISTTSAFVLAANDVLVVKHGNRKVSSASGSSDVLQALGIHTDFTIEDSVHLLNKTGITFLHAPNVHPKLKRIGEVRRAIGRPTIFNMVGPLTNPANLTTQLVGINRPDFVRNYAEVLRLLGRKRAVVVSGTQGMDEASLDQDNSFALLENGEIKSFSVDISALGLTPAPVSALRGGNPEENASILRELLDGKQSAYFDAVLLNAGLALFANGKATSVKDGVELARESILSRKALEKLDAVVEYSQSILKERAV